VKSKTELAEALFYDIQNAQLRYDELCVTVRTRYSLYALDAILDSDGVNDLMTKRCREFDRLLQAAIDYALVSLGDSVKQAIYFHLESKFNIPRKQVPENLKEFQLGLEKIFGAGARFIEILIMKNLHSKMGMQLNINGAQLEFTNYVKAAERDYVQTQTTRISVEICEGLDVCAE
jgi:hypothetical protein